jgi:hypothetical protein
MDEFIGEAVRTCCWFCPTAVDRSFRPNGLISSRRSIPQVLILRLA